MQLASQQVSLVDNYSGNGFANQSTLGLASCAEAPVPGYREQSMVYDFVQMYKTADFELLRSSCAPTS